jgi:hypothetical protein
VVLRSDAAAPAADEREDEPGLAEPAYAEAA